MDSPCKRVDVEFLQTNGKWKAFHLGGNSSCCQHIRGHYEIYRQRCAEQKIPENHYAVPREIVAEHELEKNGRQTKLDGVFLKVPGVRSFSREGVLKAVAEFIVCGDQVGPSYRGQVV